MQWVLRTPRALLPLRRASRLLSTPTKKVKKPAAPTPKTVEELYPTAMSLMHWATAGGTLACFAYVQAAINTKDKKLKGKYMQLHKSWGLVVGGLVVPRVLIRLVSKVPPHLPGNALEKLGGTLSHLYLYAMLIFMPGSGIAMGYFGGRGLPFFGYKIPGAGPEQKDGNIAKQAYLNHKKFGQFFEYFVPIHVGAVGYHHIIKGQNALRRINPFAIAKK